MCLGTSFLLGADSQLVVIEADMDSEVTFSLSFFFIIIISGGTFDNENIGNRTCERLV